MEINKTTTIRKTETTDIELTEEQVSEILLDHLGITGSLQECTVSFDISSGMFLRGVRIHVVKEVK